MKETNTLDTTGKSVNQRFPNGEVEGPRAGARWQPRAHTVFRAFGAQAA